MGTWLATWLATLGALIVAGPPTVHADDAFDKELSAIMNEWAIANYRTPENQKEDVFQKLMAKSSAFADAHPQRPEALIWDGIVQSTYAGVDGGIGALGPAKKARARFEAALAIDETAMAGSAHTSLGTLYHRVPGWPIAFGSDKKAREHLQKAVQIAPGAIDTNFFYGEFLLDEGEYEKALQHLEVAQKAPPRPGREVADKGRQAEISALIAKAREKLG
jgi:tetratricopeptide (TPR) repeat protein